MTVPAPTYRLPQQSIVSIEYPGPVASTSASTDAAIQTLGGVARLSRALNKSEGVVELNFRSDVTFSHSMGGETVDAGSMVVLKIVKRRRRKGKKSKIVGEQMVEEAGVYKVEAVGSVSKVVRFRAMADLQYQREDAEADPTVQLANAMRNMDIKTLQEFRFPEPHEDFEHDLRLLPPPVISRLALPQIYDYRANPLSAVVTTTKEDGTEVTRLVNKTKYKGELLITIPFDTPTEKIPKGPPEIKGRTESRTGLESGVLQKLQKLFEERPIWSRAGLLNHLTRAERGRVQNYKIAIPSVCWSFSDGPFRESCIRFGYDPRLHREARFYQRIMIRNMQNKQYYMKKIVGASVAGKGELAVRDNDGDSHIFNGITVNRTIGNYQLCDITDPYLAKLIQSEEYVREDCDYRDGWWDGEYYELIRQVLRRQFFSILNDNVQLPEEAMQDLVGHLDEYARLNEKGPYQQVGRTASQAPQLEEGTPAIAAEEESTFEPEGSVAPQQKRKSSSLKHIGKRMVKPKAKALSLDETIRARSRFGSTFDADQGSQAPSAQMENREDTVMEEPEEEE